jgi:general secretion pathway protein H
MTPGASRIFIDRRANMVSTTWFHMARMGRKAGLDRQPTSRAGRRDQIDSEHGFTLLEVVCVVAIIAMIAAVLLPKIPRGTSRPRLEAYALEVAALLKSDRNAALRRRAQIITEINATGRLVRSGATGRVVRVPNDVAFDAILPERCNQRPAFSTISFFASGTSCGGAIALTRLGLGYEVRVSWLTGGVQVAPHNAF